jgi:hypothetical protein
VAVAVGLRGIAASGIAGIEDTSERALAKLEQVLPARLRRRVQALQSYAVTVPLGGPQVDPQVLATLAATTILVIGLLMTHVFTGWAERVAPAKAFRSQDPILLELYDWDDLPVALTARGFDPSRTFIAATRWEDCAKAFYAVGDRFRSLCLAGDNIHFTYLADAEKFRGMDAVIVDRYANLDAVRYNLDGHFETFSEDVPIRLNFHGRKMHDLRIVRATHFDGTWPKPRIGAKGRQ